MPLLRADVAIELQLRTLGDGPLKQRATTAICCKAHGTGSREVGFADFCAALRPSPGGTLGVYSQKRFHGKNPLHTGFGYIVENSSVWFILIVKLSLALPKLLV